MYVNNLGMDDMDVRLIVPTTQLPVVHPQTRRIQRRQRITRALLRIQSFAVLVNLGVVLWMLSTVTVAGGSVKQCTVAFQNNRALSARPPFREALTWCSRQGFDLTPTIIMAMLLVSACLCVAVIRYYSLSSLSCSASRSKHSKQPNRFWNGFAWVGLVLTLAIWANMVLTAVDWFRY